VAARRKRGGIFASLRTDERAIDDHPVGDSR
jgi:hypothetical protein